MLHQVNFPTVHGVMQGVVQGAAGLHLEIDPRGGKMSIHEKDGGGAKPCVHVHKHKYTRGSGGMLP